jgi:uncharacterized phage-associated protein
MLISRDREKLINVIVYFGRNTRFCGKTKLFKLLYLLDFQHFRATGRSVTGLDYRAWELGPVPFPLVQEWDAFKPDLAAAVDVVVEPVFDYERLRIEPKAQFDDRHFTKRELQMMCDLAERHRDELTKPLVGLTHEERGPWDKIWDSGRGDNQRIPYTLSVPDDAPNREAILEASSQYESMTKADSSRH